MQIWTASIIAALVAAGADCHVRMRWPHAGRCFYAPQTASAFCARASSSYRYFVPGMAVLVDRDAADRSHQKYISPKGLEEAEAAREAGVGGRSKHVHQTARTTTTLLTKLPEQCTVRTVTGVETNHIIVRCSVQDVPGLEWSDTFDVHDLRLDHPQDQIWGARVCKGARLAHVPICQAR